MHTNPFLQYVFPVFTDFSVLQDYRLYANTNQKHLINDLAIVSRKVYNTCQAICNKQYQDDKPQLTILDMMNLARKWHRTSPHFNHIPFAYIEAVVIAFFKMLNQHRHNDDHIPFPTFLEPDDLFILLTERTMDFQETGRVYFAGIGEVLCSYYKVQENANRGIIILKDGYWTMYTWQYEGPPAVTSPSILISELL
jgi:hypothetical protein